MAVRTESVVVGWTDDYDSSEHDAKTKPTVVEFEHRGKAYRADLTKINADTLNAALAVLDDFATKLRPSPAQKKRPPRASSPDRDYDLADLREWAAATSVKIPSRGRIPAAVVQDYKKAKDNGWNVA